jgi:branched-chain amino acid transport system ATP-binding protein
MSNTPLISARGLRKQFGAVFAARDMTVDISAQTITGLIGTNGAGKTTFVNMLTGYMKPDQGQILFEGQEITGRPPREITRLGIVRSFQIPQLFISQTLKSL